MKILFISFYYPPDLSAGSFRALALSECVEEYKNHSMDIVTTYPNRYADYSPPSKQKEAFKNIEITRIRVPKHASGMLGQIISFVFFAFKLMLIIRNKQYDRIIVTSSRLASATLGAVVSYVKDAVLIIDLRDLFTETIMDVLGADSAISKRLGSFLRLLEKWTFRRAKLINVVSPGFTDYVKKINPSAKVTEYTNGIDPIFLDCAKMQGGSVTGKKIHIVYAGNVGASQDIHQLVPKFAKRFTDRIVFHVYGAGGKFDMLKLRLSELGIDNVKLHGSINREALPEIYSSADILFLTLSNKKAFEKVIPSKLFEYAATNKPILAGLIGYSREFAHNEIEGTFIFDPTDDADLDRRFNEICSNICDFDRSKFVANYQRGKIMSEFVHAIFTLTNN